MRGWWYRDERALYKTGREFDAAPGTLLDLPFVRPWFARLRAGIDEDLYTYEQTLEGHSDPRVRGERYRQLSSCDCLGVIDDPSAQPAAVRAVRT